MKISYQTEFCAGYRLYRDDWSEEQNRQTYGICASPNGHGHNYLFTVCVKGLVDSETGMLVDYQILKHIVDREIVSKVDHLNLNKDIDFLKGVVPTNENLLIAFWEILTCHLPSGVILDRLSIQESRDYLCEYFGPENE